FHRDNDTSDWVDFTGAGLLLTNLNLGLEIVGIARNPRLADLYVATGLNEPVEQGNGNAWDPGDPIGASVFRSPTRSSAWAAFGAGLPIGLPITGFAMGENTGLFLSTWGRGIWWRRDAEVIPKK